VTVSAQPFQTSSDLVQEVLSKLGVWASGQTISPEDFATVNNSLDRIFRKLAQLEIVYVSDPENIPSEWFEDIASIVAGERASNFGASGQALIDLVNNGLGGKAGVKVGEGSAAMSLKIMTRGRPTGEPQRAQYF
jgi:hypothetical protein